MNISRRQLRKILLEAIEDDSIIEPQETIQSPIQDYIDKDAEKQDNVMQVEEKRYGLPFTNLSKA